MAGQNCPLGTGNPVMCPGGRYCIDTSGAITGKCRAGFYCRQGASSPNPSPPSNTNINGLIGDMCTAGHYCLEGERLNFMNYLNCTPTMWIRLYIMFQCSL